MIGNRSGHAYGAVDDSPDQANHDRGGGWRETAEDVIARMLDRATVLGDVNIQVNQIVGDKDVNIEITIQPTTTDESGQGLPSLDQGHSLVTVCRIRYYC